MSLSLALLPFSLSRHMTGVNRNVRARADLVDALAFPVT